MPTYFNQDLPVFPQRNVNDARNPTTGRVGVYSNYDLNSTVTLLQQAPLANHIPGTGYWPHGLQFSRWFTGADFGGFHFPMADPGLGTRLEGFRFNPLSWKGLPGAKVFSGLYGHSPFRQVEYAEFTPYIYQGIGTQNERFFNPGHGLRLIGDPGAPASFGRSNPYDDQSDSIDPRNGLVGPGRTVTNYDYGNYPINTWDGVPSSKAL